MLKIPTIRALIVSCCLVVSIGISNAQQTVNFSFTQSPLPAADFGITYKPDKVSYIFSDSSVAPNQSIQAWFWDFGDGNTSTGQFTSHTYAQMGVYNVCLAIRTNKSCRDTFCRVASSWVGIGDEDKARHAFKISPNPFRDELSIEFEIFRRGEVNVEVYNMIGESVEVLMSGMQEPGIKKLSFDASKDENRSGVYFIKVMNEDVVLTEKVVKTL